MKLGAEFDNCTWFGRGPRENYSDRKTGSDVGLWKSSVDDMAEFYVRPQENGCRSDVRWAEFTGKGGRGVLFSFPKPLFVTATRYEWEDLDFVRHRGGHANGGANNRRTARPFAEPRDEIVLNIDAAQMGLGNGCLGPRPLASYMLVTRPESFTYVMRPCTSGAASLALLARSGAPVEVPKPPRKLRKVPQGEVKVIGVSSFEKGEGESEYLIDGEINGFPFAFVKNLLISVVIGFLASFIVTGMMKRKLKSVRGQREAADYMKKGSMNLRVSRDTFLYRNVTRTKKENKSSSDSDRNTGGGKF
jgi:hypothetical protein